ncbi:MAG: type II toxin-antitoxin system RelE/ParE family toxin [Elusimicrobia bacterium]|nr:type II toxin-antitoxin system RelE/ParE family toxin [Elusimicrobiota bacterium]
MKTSVFWTERARSDFLAIKSYLQERSPQGSRRVARNILRRTRRLARFPLSGRTVPEFAGLKPDLREIIVGKYRVVYCLASGSGKTARAVILAVFHARQEFPGGLL